MMNYVINDVENLLVLDQINLLSLIRSKCESITISNSKLVRYSSVMKEKLNSLSNVKVLEPDDNFFLDFSIKHKSILKGIGHGDQSSMYLAKMYGYTLVTLNKAIHKAARILKIKVVSTEALIAVYVENNSLINLFNEVKA